MRFALVILITFAASLTATAADITLREEAAAVPGVLVRLGDVATIRGVGAEVLAEAPLMPSPAPGTSQHLSAGAVRDLLKAQGVDPGRHEFRGAYRIQVTTPLGKSAPAFGDAATSAAPAPLGDSSMAFRVRTGAAVPMTATDVIRQASPRQSKTVEDAIKAAIQQTLDGRRQAGEPRLAVRSVEVTSTTVNELLEKIGQPLTAAIASTSGPQAGPLQCKVWPAEGLADEPYLILADLVEQPMRAVATTPLSRGALVTASAVRLEPTPLEEIGRSGAVGFASLEEAISKETTRPIRVGEVYSDLNTAPPLMVRKNDVVKVVSGGGGVMVTMHMNATQDGRTGDLIVVKTIDGDERFAARVVGPRRLSVLAGGPVQLGGLQ
ncbi:flagellar basal body P-ring formation chaperone FlgA [Botrimarina mediterranea]|uniref:Flagellar basal body P-ring biosynthesis protein FlgA n=1 Tax=Botrimarina mediterranea TaxID=2528022 RepID=A0A518K4J8_9BACT|nr:flagellar basal body P-ring formation chaperone FlgA [Botrimarina mediterranea]QDV72685.1 flagellar basal body P-ring biosynthesis protein FlgA [Botrimarina mediterranea]QDV77257.1 flagellar basal body P-ring biosynthesis protein FlgA [Planctomycetes bacterium K2D]